MWTIGQNVNDTLLVLHEDVIAIRQTRQSRLAARIAWIRRSILWRIDDVHAHKKTPARDEPEFGNQKRCD